EIVPKRVQLLHELVPTARVLALLVNPTNSTVAETQSREALSAANALGLELHILNASTDRDFDAVFSSLIQLRAGGLVVAADPLFSGRNAACASARGRVPRTLQLHPDRECRGPAPASVASAGPCSLRPV